MTITSLLRKNGNLVFIIVKSHILAWLAALIQSI